MIDVEIKTTEPQTVAFIAMKGAYDQIPQAMGRLYRWVTQHGFHPGGMPGAVYYTAPGVAEESEAVWELRAPLAGSADAREVDETGCGIKQAEAQLVASTIHKGPYEQIAETYEQLGAWVPENGYFMAGPPEEIYLTDPETTPPEEYLTEIRIPIARP